MTGYISSVQSLGTVDGPNVRSVVFGVGCPLRCGYCHNPETRFEKGTAVEAEELVRKLLRYKPYYARGGGVTFSGGEPLLQAEFFAEAARMLKAEGVHIAIDTCGHGWERAKELLALIDLAIVDVKFTTEDEYAEYCGGSLAEVRRFLEYLKTIGKRVWIRQVIVPTLNDNEENLRRLKEFLTPFEEITDKLEFLPFRKICLEKYAALGMKFPFEKYDEANDELTAKLTEQYNRLRVAKD